MSKQKNKNLNAPSPTDLNLNKNQDQVSDTQNSTRETSLYAVPSSDSIEEQESIDLEDEENNEEKKVYSSNLNQNALVNKKQGYAKSTNSLASVGSSSTSQSGKIEPEVFNPNIQAKYIETYTALGKLLSSSPISKPPPRQLAMALAHQILHSPLHHTSGHSGHSIQGGHQVINLQSLSHGSNTQGSQPSNSHFSHSQSQSHESKAPPSYQEGSNNQDSDIISWSSLKLIVANILQIVKNQMKESNPVKRRNMLWILVALCLAFHSKDSHELNHDGQLNTQKSQTTQDKDDFPSDGTDDTTENLDNDYRQDLGNVLFFLMQIIADRDSKVRFSAVEATYNICNMFRGEILKYFPNLFDAVCKLSGDSDPAVRNANILLTRLIKDIVAEDSNFDVDTFVALIQERVSTTNPYLRQFLLDWILLLNTIPDIHLMEYLPRVLPGIFLMCTDSNKQIVTQAQNALDQFLEDLKQLFKEEINNQNILEGDESASQRLFGNSNTEYASLSVNHVDLGSILHIVLEHCISQNSDFRLIALNWIRSLLEMDVKRTLSIFYASILQAILPSISHKEEQVRVSASIVNKMLQKITTDSLESKDIQFDNIIALIKYELGLPTMPSRVCALNWLQVLLNKDFDKVISHIEELYVFLLNALIDSQQEVINMVLDVLASMASTQTNFSTLIYHLLDRMCNDKRLLSRAGPLIRQMSGMLNTEKLFREISITLRRNPFGEQRREFCSFMVQTLNIILLTSQELTHVRDSVRKNCILKNKDDSSSAILDSDSRYEEDLFSTLYKTWCFNPVATLSLCLLSKRYRLACLVVQTFSQCEITVQFLSNIDNLVQLLESPLFIDLRLQLLEPQKHPYLLKTLYGILMLLPQGAAYNKLNQRLQPIGTLFLVTQHTQGLYPSQNEEQTKIGNQKRSNILSDDETENSSCDDLLEHFQNLNFSQFDPESDNE